MQAHMFYKYDNQSIGCFKINTNLCFDIKTHCSSLITIALIAEQKVQLDGVPNFQEMWKIYWIYFYIKLNRKFITFLIECKVVIFSEIYWILKNPFSCRNWSCIWIYSARFIAIVAHCYATWQNFNYSIASVFVQWCRRCYPSLSSAVAEYFKYKWLIWLLIKS